MRTLALITAPLLLVLALDAAAQSARCWTDEEVLRRNPNPSRAMQLEPWPAHRIIDNVYYVGTRNLGSFLITTDEGHILINTNDPETLPLVRQSVETLGFNWGDIAVILGSHAHADHMSANGIARRETGGEVVVMRDDVPLLVAMDPGDGQPVADRIIDDGDKVTLGDTTLTAHLTPGHSPGTTTWTMTASESGQRYAVVFLGGATATPRQDVTDPEIQAQFHHAFLALRGLACDVPLAPHTPIHHMEEKYARLQAGEAGNPYVDTIGCQDELALSERGFYLLLRRQLDRGP